MEKCAEGIALAGQYAAKGSVLAVIDKAIDNLEQTITINPKDIDASKLYSQVLVSQERYSEAIAVLQEAIEQNPVAGDLYYYMAQIFKKIGDKDNYSKYLKMALKNHLLVSSEVYKRT